ncbi:uncharacterized protein LACBIDRAFT_315222 [Laccaria bicolor S238N-H82]|uniref:Predicted protein n=1 Tax=Laccaria bicolor (strain S238N-H82 / ATCC MYA-4686) TaxID=486041 RepID=B0E043_LACBS|nr:uncharacterized protein LACBIDRAFT_315222 [Laccaria bicolor S238N-H82]EDQ99755.1 predicted protein [Laccaria bicolor S238N-H82]|eukprot:XP_001889591.1 predicted protein [Laccaria bicolor S238N-H82]
MRTWCEEAIFLGIVTIWTVVILGSPGESEWPVQRRFSKRFRIDSKMLNSCLNRGNTLNHH